MKMIKSLILCISLLTIPYLTGCGAASDLGELYNGTKTEWKVGNRYGASSGQERVSWKCKPYTYCEQLFISACPPPDAPIAYEVALVEGNKVFKPLDENRETVPYRRSSKVTSECSDPDKKVTITHKLLGYGGYTTEKSRLFGLAFGTEDGEILYVTEVNIGVFKGNGYYYEFTTWKAYFPIEGGVWGFWPL